MPLGHMILTAHLLLPAAGAPPVAPVRTLTAAVHEAARLTTPVAAPQAAATRRSGGGPVMWGAVIGGTAGLVGGALQPTHSNGEYVLGGSRVQSALVLGAVGAGFGALVGWGIKSLRH